MSLYVGVNGSPRKVNKLLVGVNGIAKEVKTGYTGGVNSGLNQVYSSRINIDQEIANANPVKALTSGQFTTADIGKTVYLSNSAVTCQEWRVADVNHDGTSGTVDLFPKYTLTTEYMVFSNSSQYYANSNIRTWLNGTVLGGFTAEIQSAMKVQNFPSNGATLSDKVKCPSLDEVGCHNASAITSDYGGDYVIAEGTIYPIFGTQQLRPNSSAIYSRPNNGGTTWYWTRSRYTNSSYYVWYVNSNGYCDGNGYISSYDVVACIRF